LQKGLTQPVIPNDFAKMMNADVFLESVMEKMKGVVQSAGKASTRDGMIQHFLEAREECKRRDEHLAGNRNVFQLRMPHHSHNNKPSKKTNVSIGSSAPLIVSNLTIDSTHRLRYLPGRVAVADSFRRVHHMYMLLEDVKGDIVQVCVYNMSRIYKKGDYIAILEPYFKTGVADMIPFIRIDEPSDIVTWKAPVSSLQWKEVGNTFYKKAKDTATAIHCYEQGLQSPKGVEKRSELAVLFTNVALCESCLGHFERSAWFAGTAVFLNDDNQKAWYRLVDSLQHFDLGACKEVIKEAPSSTELEKLVRKVDTQTQKKRNSMVDTTVFSGKTAWSASKASVSFAPAISTSTNAESIEKQTFDMREKARSLFVNKDFTGAKELYIQEIRLAGDTTQSMADLVSNIGAAYLVQNDLADAMLFSTIGVMLQRGNVKPWIRRGIVFEKVKGPHFALEYFKGVAAEAPLLGMPSFLTSCEKEVARIEQQIEHRMHVEEVDARTTAQQLKDRQSVYHEASGMEDYNGIDDYISQIEPMLCMSRIALKSAPKEKLTPILRICKNLASRACPKIHEEFPREKGWPTGLDTSLVQKTLYKDYLNSDSNPWINCMVMSKGEFPWTPAQMLKRWNGPENASLFSNMKENGLQIGSIVDARQNFDGIRYLSEIRSLFINSPCNPLAQLDEGSVHVSVGFNDLGELLTYPTNGPMDTIHFVAIDKSEFCIARSLVTHEMLKDTCIPIEHVFQIWYSASWSSTALESFRRACKEALKSQRAGTFKSETSSERKVMSYIHCWLSEDPISVAESRARWFGNLQNNECGVAFGAHSFKRLPDRLSTVHYLLTGELIPDANTSRTSPKDKPSVGSMTFWNVPPNSPPLEYDIVFNTILMETLIADMNADENIMDTIMRIKINQLTKLRTRLVDCTITLAIWCGELRPDTRDLIDDIVFLQPHTMSWSNIVDYNKYDSFHAMAREFGASRHYGYSMNWSTAVYGACLLDYACIGGDIAKTNKLFKEVLQVKSHPLLTKPFFGTPINLVNEILAPKMKKNWLDHFSQGQATIVNNTIIDDSPMYRSNGTLYMEWKYDV
jgi:hypothetical protein